MKLWINRWKTWPLLLVAVIPILVLVITRVNTAVVERVEGGVYVGELPSLGMVQLELFREDKDFEGWVYREGIDFLQCRVAPDSNSPEFFTAEIMNRNSWETNANMKFRFGGSGRTVEGRISAGTNSPAELFVLKRVAEHRAISQLSRAVFGRFGANTKFFGQFPLIEATDTFHAALQRKLVQEVSAEAGRFTSGNLERHWEILWHGDAVWEGHNNPQWQMRLLTDQLASFAEWSAPDYGGNGNLTIWKNRNYVWQNGKLKGVTLKDLFRQDMDWEAEIRRLCNHELERQGEESPARAVLDTTVDLSIFTLSPTGLQIYINPYIIGGGGDGEFIIHIPYPMLKKYFKPGWPASALPIFGQEAGDRPEIAAGKSHQPQ